MNYDEDSVSQSVSWAGLGSLSFWFLVWIGSLFVAFFLESLLKSQDGSLRAVVYSYCIASVALSAALYELRRLRRTWYGLIEMVVMFLGAATGFIAIIKHGGYKSPLPSDLAWIDGLPVSLTWVASIYLGVRAFDNIGEGLRPGSWARYIWDGRIFPKK